MRNSSASSPESSGRLGSTRQIDRPLRTAETPFAIGDQREQRGLAAHSASGAQFGKRLGPIAAVVRRYSDGLANRGDPAGPGPRGAGMAQGRFRIVVEQLPGGDQVPCHRVGGGAVQGAQLAPDLGRQLPGVDVLRYRGTVGSRDALRLR